MRVLIVLFCFLLGCELSATPTAERAAPLNERELARLDNMPSPGAPDPGGSWSQLYAMVGREDLAASLSQPPSRLCEPLMRNGAAANPVDEIVARAAAAQMVVISEGHDSHC